MPIFHIRSKDRRDAALAAGRTLRVKIRAVKTEGDVDAEIRGFRGGGWPRRMWEEGLVQIKRRLRRY